MRSTEDPKAHLHDVEELARRNRREEKPPEVEPRGHRVRLCWDGVCGVRCYEVDVEDEGGAKQDAAPRPERDLGSACEPLS